MNSNANLDLSSITEGQTELTGAIVATEAAASVQGSGVSGVGNHDGQANTNPDLLAGTALGSETFASVSTLPAQFQQPDLTLPAQGVDLDNILNLQQAQDGVKPVGSKAESQAKGEANISIVRRLKIAATQGNSRAQFDLSVRYGVGDGVEISDYASLYWCCLAAGQGYAPAQSHLGLRYRVGDGVEQNNPKAAHLFRLAADQGNSEAQINLGLMYKDGQGIEQNDEEAVRLFRMAAVEGEPHGQYLLGVMYYYGRGVRQDNSTAEDWLCRACVHGHEDALQLVRHLNALDV